MFPIVSSAQTQKALFRFVCAFESPVHSISLAIARDRDREREWVLYYCTSVGRIYFHGFQPKIKCVFLLWHFVCVWLVVCVPSIVKAPIFIHFFHSLPFILFHTEFKIKQTTLFHFHQALYTFWFWFDVFFSLLFQLKMLQNAWFRMTTVAAA